MKTSALVLTVVGFLAFSLAAQARQFPTTNPTFESAIPVASTGNGFGEKGQVVMSSDFNVDIVYNSIRPPEGDAVSLTDVRVAPALDWFVAKNIAIGGLVVFGYQKGAGLKGSETTVQLGPNIGFNVEMAGRVSFFPKLGAGYRLISQSSKSPLGGTSSVTGHVVTVFASAPILFHPAPHFFVGFGPIISLDLLSKVEGNDGTKNLVGGLAMHIGGWW